jgi:hypothetical protein
MYPNSPYAVPVGSFRVPVVPPSADVTDNLITVAISKDWLPFVLGAMKQLLLETTWVVETPEVLDVVQAKAFNLIQMLATPVKAQECGDCECDEMTWRQEGCKLILSCNGVDTFVYDPTTCIQGGTVQPGSNTPPNPGDCQIFHAVLQGNNQWLLPVQCNAGDTITVSNAKGAWNDGGHYQWTCPDGSRYILGSCGAAGDPLSGDPVPSVPHMRLVGQFGTVWNDGIGTYTIPVGSTNLAVVFQANDSDLSNNLGSISFDVQYCAKANPKTWEHTFDFTTGGASGWVDVPSGGSTLPHQVFSSDGAKSQVVYSPDFSTYYNIVFMKYILAKATTLTTYQVFYADGVTTDDPDG